MAVLNIYFRIISRRLKTNQHFKTNKALNHYLLDNENIYLDIYKIIRIIV